MKKLLLFSAILLLFIHSSSAQNLALKLDEKNGFKDLKINSLFSDLKQDLTFMYLEDNIKYYKYSGVCCSVLFQTSLESITLGYFNNRLKVIVLETSIIVNPNRTAESPVYIDLKNDFDILFGFVSRSYRDSNKVLRVFCEWKGANLGLTLEHISGSLEKIGGQFKRTAHCRVTIYELNKQSLDDGF